ncbi:hypothetical protein BDW75DRAFT_242861 [Aspergillus navahoensis]
MVGNLIGVKDLGINNDFFVSGLDSRQVQILAATPARSLRDQKDILFLRNAVYMNPTASGLVDYIRRNAAEDVSATLDALFDKYGALHASQQISNGFPDSEPVSVPAIVVNHFKGDLSRPLFGLQEGAYAHLVSTVTEEIYWQCPVTFNLPLALFEPQIAGTANLVQLADDSPQNTRIIFLSSIATIQGWEQGMPVLEAPLSILNTPEADTDRARCSAKPPLQAMSNSAVCRVGQMVGPVHADGKWPERDWFKTLLRASEMVGVLPQSPGHFGDVDRLSVDSLSTALVTLALDLEDLDTDS